MAGRAHPAASVAACNSAWPPFKDSQAGQETSQAFAGKGVGTAQAVTSAAACDCPCSRAASDRQPSMLAERTLRLHLSWHASRGLPVASFWLQSDPWHCSFVAWHSSQGCLRSLTCNGLWTRRQAVCTVSHPLVSSETLLLRRIRHFHALLTLTLSRPGMDDLTTSPDLT